MLKDLTNHKGSGDHIFSMSIGKEQTKEADSVAAKKVRLRTKKKKPL